MSVCHVLTSSLPSSYMDCDFGVLSLLLLDWPQWARRQGVGHVYGCFPILVSGSINVFAND